MGSKGAEFPYVKEGIWWVLRAPHPHKVRLSPLFWLLFYLCEAYFLRVMRGAVGINTVGTWAGTAFGDCD